MNENELNNLERSIGRIEGKIDGILEHLRKINGSIEKHDCRIDTIEQEISRHKGIVAGISAVVSIIVSVISFFLKEK